ncbi:hypothetical protein AAMO2058_000957000 [Amorphochlora amoebiformis]
MKVRGLKQGGNTKRRTHSQSYLSNPIWTQSDKPEALVLDWLKGEVERRRETSGHIPELVVEIQRDENTNMCQIGLKIASKTSDGKDDAMGSTSNTCPKLLRIQNSKRLFKMNAGLKRLRQANRDSDYYPNRRFSEPTKIVKKSAMLDSRLPDTGTSDIMRSKSPLSSAHKPSKKDLSAPVDYLRSPPLIGVLNPVPPVPGPKEISPKSGGLISEEFLDIDVHASPLAPIQGEGGKQGMNFDIAVEFETPGVECSVDNLFDFALQTISPTSKQNRGRSRAGDGEVTPSFFEDIRHENEKQIWRQPGKMDVCIMLSPEKTSPNSEIAKGENKTKRVADREHSEEEGKLISLRQALRHRPISEFVVDDFAMDVRQ